MSKETILTGWLIDPYQKYAHQVQVKNDINDWYRLLDCDCLDIAHAGDYNGLPIDIWVNDNGLNLNPIPPLFRWVDYPNPLAGYGLVLSSDSQGESISTNLERRELGRFIHFEEWERRIDPEKYFDQLSRIYPGETQIGNYGIGGRSFL